ncbi:Kiwa anti-phage protein KwaB-like domain-containing protein [Photobacterium piscicola]|uniref:Kiwa anti-phage protein KwaB-like domain-containing protein n=1 Tax=Photobacterium piscicola TaxID=1378299 RepID=UPI0037362E66
MNNVTYIHDGLNVKLEQLKNVCGYLSQPDMYVSINMYVAKLNCKKESPIVKDLKQLIISPNIEDKLKKILVDTINNYDYIYPLQDINVDSNEHLYHEQVESTDFHCIKEKIYNQNLEAISDPNKLSSYNSYIYQVTITDGSPENERILYAVKYIANSWKLNQCSTFFLNKKQAELTNNPSEFCLYDTLTFIVLDDSIFVREVDKFQTVMQYIERLENRKQATVAELKDLNLINNDGHAILLKTIGTDKTLMKQLVSAQKSGYYKNPAFSDALKQVVMTDKLGFIEFHDDGSIVIKEDKAYIKELLILLHDKRVRTLILQQVVDVDGNLLEHKQA